MSPHRRYAFYRYTTLYVTELQQPPPHGSISTRRPVIQISSLVADPVHIFTYLTLLFTDNYDRRRNDSVIDRFHRNGPRRFLRADISHVTALTVRSGLRDLCLLVDGLCLHGPRRLGGSNFLSTRSTRGRIHRTVRVRRPLPALNNGGSLTTLDFTVDPRFLNSQINTFVCTVNDVLIATRNGQLRFCVASTVGPIFIDGTTHGVRGTA